MVTLANLAAGLDQFGSHYKSIGVFACDVWDLDPCEPFAAVFPGGFSTLATSKGGSRFLQQIDNRMYSVVVMPGRGTVHLSRSTEPLLYTVSEDGNTVTVRPGNYAAGVWHGPDRVIVAAVAKSRRIIDAYQGASLGLLWGDRIDDGRRVFTVEFHTKYQRWHAYDGGLVSWMKTALAGET